MPVGAGEVMPSPDRVTVTAVPNPFNPSTTVKLRGVVEGPVTVVVHDAAGRIVKRLLGAARSGSCDLVWDGRDEQGRAATSGAYFLRVSTPDGGTRMGKITMLK